MDGHERAEAVGGLERVAAAGGDGHPLLKHRVRRGDPHADDHLRPDQPQLLLQPRPAGLDLALVGLVVDAPLAPALVLGPLEVLDRIGDVQPGTVETGLRQRRVQQPPGRPHEGPAGQVLLVAGLLAHQPDPGMRGALTEDGLRGVPVEIAVGARRGGALELIEGGASHDR